MPVILRRLEEPSTWSAFGGIALMLGIASEDWIQYPSLGTVLASFALGIILQESGEA